MVEFLSDIRPDAFVRRPGNNTGISPSTAKSTSSGTNPAGGGLGSRRDDTTFRGGPFTGASTIELSDGARSALYGSERALDLARDFNAARLGRPARHRLGQFFQGFGRGFGETARDLDKTARRIERLAEDLDRRFGDLAERIFSRLDSGLGGGFRSAEISFSQLNFSLTVESTLLSVVKDGEQSLLRLDKVQLSLEAVQVDIGVSLRDRVGFAPKTPLFELPDGLSPSEIADRLIAAFGTQSVSASVEAQEIQLDLSRTVFAATVSDGPSEGAENTAGNAEPESGVDVVA